MRKNSKRKIRVKLQLITFRVSLVMKTLQMNEILVKKFGVCSLIAFSFTGWLDDDTPVVS